MFVCLFVFFTFRLILGVHGEFAAKNALLGQNSERGQLRFLKGAAEEIAPHLGLEFIVIFFRFHRRKL